MPGKVILKKKTCQISNGRRKYSVLAFEVLIDTTKFVWEASNELEIHQNAVLCGKTCMGVNLYVGRSVHDSKVVLGKVRADDRKLYYFRHGREQKTPHYEVLVKATAQFYDENEVSNTLTFDTPEQALENLSNIEVGESDDDIIERPIKIKSMDRFLSEEEVKRIEDNLKDSSQSVLIPISNQDESKFQVCWRVKDRKSLLNLGLNDRRNPVLNGLLSTFLRDCLRNRHSGEI